MTEPTNELIFEVLKAIQGDMAEMRKTQAEHGQQFIGIRDQIHDVQGQIHSLHGDLLRVEKGVTALRGDVDRVKRRLDLVDA